MRKQSAVACVSWGHSEQIACGCSGWDLIIGADCVYTPELFAPLLQTIGVAVEASPVPPRVVLAAEHGIFGDNAAAEFFDDWDDGGQMIVGGAGGSRPATPDERYAAKSVAKELSATLLFAPSGSAGRTVMAASGFRDAVKTWENSNRSESFAVLVRFALIFAHVLGRRMAAGEIACHATSCRCCHVSGLSRCRYGHCSTYLIVQFSMNVLDV